MSRRLLDSPGFMRVWRPVALAVARRGVLAMQKVDGSSPFIRS